jgi:hypothetical protein
MINTVMHNHDVYIELYKRGALMFSMLSGGNRVLRISPG